ncbi:wax ester synthase/diacylglycerol acyltransferase 4-like [Vicia villosa]|uniref:wax ester synthase/diacylglycerol acyltransferase 4-like n=1 Tax=Vicia villosa TaxID=3911 RepID=UPI00273BF51F|nr:wax ester synthase/diacylglycerol acyltransferase 4-like [Vicia villosa]
MEHEKEEYLEEPVSPVGQYFNSSSLCLYIIAVLEFEVAIDDLQALVLLKDVFLPISPRFSSIMVQEKNEDKRWKKVDVNLKDHMKTPIFSKGNSIEFYDKHFHDYLSTIAIEPLPQGKPLWEIHIVNYPTKTSLGNIIFKLHHALGDGYSLMGALLSCLQRADNPSLPLSFPSLKPSKSEASNTSFWRKISCTMSSVFNTASDFGWSVLKSSFIDDDKTPIRPGGEGADFQPISISSIEFSIDHIKDIKSKLGVTLNDVVTGIVFYGTRLYMQEKDSKSNISNSTALVLMNTRNIEGYQSIDDMLNAKKSKGPWGNRISFLHVPIPKLNETRISNPLGFIHDTHNIINRKKQSLAFALTGTLLDIEGKFRGQEAVAKHIRKTITMSSTVVTNLVGPVQQMSLDKHPVKGLYFTLAGGPESLVISIMSYMGMLRVTLKTERDFIDEQRLKSCMQNAFEMIFKEAMKIDCETN